MVGVLVPPGDLQVVHDSTSNLGQIACVAFQYHPRTCVIPCYPTIGQTREVRGSATTLGYTASYQLGQTKFVVHRRAIFDRMYSNKSGQVVAQL